MSTGGKRRQIAVRGTVIPVSWDVVGVPTRVAILTVDEGEYRIAPDGVGKRLFRLLREEVMARILLDFEGGSAGDAELVSFMLADRGGPHAAGGAPQQPEAPPIINEQTEGTVGVCDEC